MPYVRKTKKGSRRPRRYRRKQRKMLSFTKAPIPNKFATKLRYVDWATLDPGAGGSAAVHVVKSNGCYDPNFTGVGHQPRGFDQFMSLYDHFCVIGAKITVDVTTGYGSAFAPLMVGVALKDTTTAYTNANDYMEGRNVVSRIIGGTSISGNANTAHFTKTFSTRKFLGRSHPLSDPQLKGNISSDPTELASFHIFAAPLASTDENILTINYRIEYLVVFIEPKQPSQS